MDENRLSTALSGLVGNQLAEKLAGQFVAVRRDYATNTLERSGPGKFVETFVQCLQFISTGNYDSKPSVDHYLNTKVENDTLLPDGLRFSAGRIARSMYTLRNKRSIAHIGDVDPNEYDLAYLHQGASWILSELLREAQGISMSEAGALIQLVQAPVGTLVEEIDGVRLVHANVTARSELLILLHSHYPDKVSRESIRSTMSRRSESSVSARLSDLKADKLLVGDANGGYKLTTPGYNEASQIVVDALDKN